MTRRLCNGPRSFPLRSRDPTRFLRSGSVHRRSEPAGHSRSVSAMTLRRPASASDRFPPSAIHRPSANRRCLRRPTGWFFVVRAEPVWPAWTDQSLANQKCLRRPAGWFVVVRGGPVWPASARVVPVVVRWAFSQSVQARLGELVWLRGSIVIVEPVPVSAVLFFQLASAPTSNCPDQNRNWFPED